MKFRSIKRMLSVGLASVLTVSMLTGCGSKPTVDEAGNPIYENYSHDDLVATVENLQSNYNTLQSQYDELSTLYEQLTTSDTPKTTISVIDAASNKYSFNSIDSNIVFKNGLGYPGSSTISPSGNIEIVKNVDINPGSNWICRMNGSSIELQHIGSDTEHSTDGISGTILVNKIDDALKQSAADIRNKVIDTYFQQLTPDQMNQAVYTEIFVGGQTNGMQAKVPIRIDQDAGYLRLGMFAFGGYAVTYVFVYRSNQDPVKDELIQTVLNSITISNQAVNITD